MTIEDKLRSFILNEIDSAKPPQELSDDYPLIETQVIDSMGIFEVVDFVEREFMVAILDEDLVPENFGTISGIARLIAAKARN